MSFKELLSKEKKNILICPYSYNEGFFREAEGEYLFDLSFIRPEDFIDGVLGTYLEDAVIFLNKNHNHTVSGANTLLSSMPFHVNSETGEYLKDYYVINEGYIEYLKDKNIIYLKKELSDPLFHLALNKLKSNNIEFKELDFTKSPNNHIYYKEYKDVISEVEGVIEKIASLLDGGTNINKIKIHISTDEYYEILKDVLSFYDIPYTSLKKTSLIETKEGIDFYNYMKLLFDDVLDDSKKVIEALDSYRETNTMSDAFYNTLIKVFSGVKSVTLEYVRDFLTKNYVKENRYIDSLEIGDVFDRSMPSDTHLFIIGAVQGAFPKTIIINGLITDNLLKKYKVPISKDLNTYNEEYYLSKLYSIDNVYITYNLQGFDKKHSAPSILDRISNKKEMTIDKSISYSKERDVFKYSKAKEIHDNYGVPIDDLRTYKEVGEKELKNIKDYNPLFKLNVDGDDDFELIKTFLNNTLRLSHTSIAHYYECPTKYFLSNLIRIDPFETNYNSYLGLFFHEFIENFIDKEYGEYEVEKLYNKFKKNIKDKTGYELLPDEAYFFKIFYGYLEKIHEILFSYRQSSTFKVSSTEYNFNHKIEDDRMNVYITGSIDLVLKDDDNNYLIADYKTGEVPKVNIDKGKGMQLFIYFNMLKEDDKNAKPFGLAYQKIPREKIDEVKEIKFNGFFIDDNTLKNDFSGGNKNIHAKKITREREDLNNLTLDAQIENALKSVNEKVIEAKDRIISLDFKQTPSNDSCQYCNFKEICYKSQINDSEEEEGSDEWWIKNR